MSANFANVVAAHSTVVDVVSITDSAAQNAAIRSWALAEGYEVPARGGVPTDLIVKAVTSGARVEVPHNGPIVVLDNGDSVAVSPARGKATLDHYAEAAGVTVSEVVAVVGVDGEALELTRRAAPVAQIATYEVVTKDGTEHDYTGHIKGVGVEGIAAALDIHPAEIATIGGRAVVVRYSLARNTDNADTE